MAKDQGSARFSRLALTCAIAFYIGRDNSDPKLVAVAKDFLRVFFKTISKDRNIGKLITELERHPKKSKLVDRLSAYLETSDLGIPEKLAAAQTNLLRATGRQLPWESPRKISYSRRPVKKKAAVKVAKHKLRKARKRLPNDRVGSIEVVSLHPSRLLFSRGVVAAKPAKKAPGKKPKPSRRKSDSIYYPVWYATNRERKMQKDQVGFARAAALKNSLSYGKCIVEIPKFHNIGSIGSGLITRILHGDDRLKLDHIEELDELSFWQNFQIEMKRVAGEGKKIALVYIHGFRNTFKDAAIRAAQIGADLGVAAATAFFSWPSRGLALGYTADENALRDTEDLIVAFLHDFAAKAGADEVHVIAHSMGNRAFHKFLVRVLDRADADHKLIFKTVILAAPDFAASEFSQLALAFPKIAGRTTLYASGKDKPLQLSGFLSTYPRAGYVPPVTIVPGIDTVEVSNIDLSFVGHNYAMELRPLLADMFQLITMGKGADERFGLIEALTDQKQKYWKLRK